MNTTHMLYAIQTWLAIEVLVAFARKHWDRPIVRVAVYGIGSTLAFALVPSLLVVLSKRCRPPPLVNGPDREYRGSVCE